MIKALINGILNLLASVIGLVLTPINNLISSLFPNVSSAISTFNTFVNTYVGGSLSYFFSILPPIFRGLLVTWFTFVISYYGIIYTYIAIKKLWEVIQKIKFW